MNALALLSLLWAGVVGLGIVAAFWPRERSWRDDAPLVLSLSFLVGLAATSITFFFASLMFARPALVAFAIEAAAVTLGFVRFRLGRVFSAVPGSAASFTWIELLFGFVVAQAALIAGVVAMRSYQSEPYGGWDGWAIWNLHAREMLRAGTGWPRLLHAPQLSWTHPDYPRLLPASVARIWAWAGGEAPAAPALLSAAFAASVVALLMAAVARVRGRVIAMAAGLGLIATPFFVTFSTNEHADIPLAAFMLAAVVLAQQEQRGFRALAGLGAAFAAWTKNEGLLFALVFAAGCAATNRRHLGASLGALAAGLVPVAYFKIALAPANDLMTGALAERLARLADAGRHEQIATAFVRDFMRWGEWQVAPYLAMALPFVAWRARCRLEASERLVPLVLMLMLTGYYGVYLLTSPDLAWHLDTSLVRLLLQLWPLALLWWGLSCPRVEPAEARAFVAKPKRVLLFAAATIAAGALVLFGFFRQPGANELAFRRGVAAAPGDGWFAIERFKDTTWVWSRGNATLHLRTASARRDVVLRFALRSLAPRTLTIRSADRVVWQGRVGDREFVPVEINSLALADGDTALEFVTDASATPESNASGARTLAFALYDFRIR